MGDWGDDTFLWSARMASLSRQSDFEPNVETPQVIGIRGKHRGQQLSYAPKFSALVTFPNTTPRYSSRVGVGKAFLIGLLGYTRPCRKVPRICGELSNLVGARRRLSPLLVTDPRMGLAMVDLSEFSRFVPQHVQYASAGSSDCGVRSADAQQS